MKRKHYNLLIDQKNTSNKNQLIYEKLGLHTEYVNQNLYSISHDQNKGSSKVKILFCNYSKSHSDLQAFNTVSFNLMASLQLRSLSNSEKSINLCLHKFYIDYVTKEHKYFKIKRQEQKVFLPLSNKHHTSSIMPDMLQIPQSLFFIMDL